MDEVEISKTETSGISPTVSVRKAYTPVCGYPIMVTELELAVLGLAVVFLFAAVRIVKAIRPLVVNTVVGLLVFLVAGWLGVGVEVDWIAVAVVAIGGLPGAVLVVLLSVFGLAFVPAFVGFAPLI